MDPVTGANTQTIESSWRALKRRLSRGGIKKDSYGLHFAEYLWFKQYTQDVCLTFVLHIAAHCAWKKSSFLKIANWADCISLKYNVLPFQSCTLGHSSFAIFTKYVFKIIAQGANDTLFYTEFRTVFLFSVKLPILGRFRFEILKNQRGGPFGEKNMKK